MQAEGGNELVSDDEYMDSVADQADLEERSRSSDRASPQTPLDAESGRGRAVSDGLGPTPDAGAGGGRETGLMFLSSRGRKMQGKES
jgi:hypothetical protein